MLKEMNVSKQNDDLTCKILNISSFLKARYNHKFIISSITVILLSPFSRALPGFFGSWGTKPFIFRSWGAQVIMFRELRRKFLIAHAHLMGFEFCYNNAFNS